MTIEQAQDAAELLKSHNQIKAIQKELKLNKILRINLMGRTVSVSEEAMPYIEEALVKAKEEIETKIAEL